MSKARDLSSHSESTLEKGTQPSDLDDSETSPTTEDASPAITLASKGQGTKA
ncbi:Major facilitator superfamily domain general substrate transporter [Penicillium tannophilum]|nr:Major facilitator superfamily domain general substrate transporter [Penicillium tannophilum]